MLIFTLTLVLLKESIKASVVFTLRGPSGKIGWEPLLYRNLHIYSNKLSSFKCDLIWPIMNENDKSSKNKMQNFESSEEI